LFLNSSQFDEKEQEKCEQIVLFEQPNQCCENHSHPNSSTSLNSSLTSPKVRRTEIAPVPDRLAITPNRYYLSFAENGDRWHVPIQLSLLEAWQLLDLVTWERDRDTIFKIVQGFVGSAIVGDSL
jgi:hypothetical protein